MNDKLLDELENADLVTGDNSYNVKLAKALARLENNKDFQLVILDGFMQEKVVSMAMQLSIPGADKGTIMEYLIAANKLRDYFIAIKNLAGEIDDETKD